MGSLHDGHVSLIRRAASECGFVVVSIFVNPTQFGDQCDLDSYPRDEAGDVALATAAGAHLTFAPAVDEVYPAGFATTVQLEGPITETFEGAVRGQAHFSGVATVVTKLFGMVQPDAAYFGQKDAQQCVVVRRLITDLNLPIELVVCPTVREPDGLAMSSRNTHLEGIHRTRAVALVEGLQAAADAVAAGDIEHDLIVKVVADALAARDVVAEYVAVVDPDTLLPLAHVDRTALVAVAAQVGPVRLIDNVLIEPDPS
jgi:pantoate--beta-alanine ligase